MRFLTTIQDALDAPQQEASSQFVNFQPETAFPVDTGKTLMQLELQFRDKKKPIAVSFRELVHWLKVGERATHHIHPYPAKLFPHIAHFFLASRQLVDRDEIVLDPFGGTGTVALEAILSGRPALYADANPLARLISAAKTRVVDLRIINEAGAHVRRRFLTSRIRTSPDVVNIERWFAADVIGKLARLRGAIASIDEPNLRDLMQVTFSAVVRKASNADPRFSVPVRRDRESAVPVDVWRMFELQLDANMRRMRALAAFTDIGTAACAGSDARELFEIDKSARLADASVGMILTSPPYAGAQKYVRASSLNLGWLDLIPSTGLRKLEDKTIGREHYPKAVISPSIKTGLPEADRFIEKIGGINPTRATIAANYLLEMRSALSESVRVLRPGGHFILVIGDNTVCGQHFASSNYLQKMLEQMGLTTILILVDPIRARGLLTRRAPTAGIIAHEFIIVFKK
jgi:hypothetical protein